MDTAATRRRWFGLDGWFVINTLVVVVLLWLPYQIFGHRLYVGGDDTRLYYAFPSEWLHEFVRSTWFNFSNVGSNNPQFAIAPLLFILSALKSIGLPPYALDHVAFSAVFIGGFLAFQAFFRELTKTDDRVVPFVVAFGYVFSPILLTNEYNIFLQSVWLIPLFPLWGFFLIRYLRTAAIGAALGAGVVSALFAYGVSGIPWVAALGLPIVAIGAIGAGTGILTINRWLIGRFVTFWLIVGLLQAFWLVPFTLQLGSSTSFAAGALGSEVVESFGPTVESVSAGMNVVYPLLNLFHHHIQIAFHWQTWDAYADFLDRFLWLDLSFLVILTLGFWASRRRRSQGAEPLNRLTTLTLIGTLVALFFFTVNLGWFKALFLALGHLPGFGMFRNYFSKFPLAYVFLYLTTIGLLLLTIRQQLPRWVRWLVVSWFALTVIVNAVPFFQGQMFNAPLWTSQQTAKNIELPAEYLDFMRQLAAAVPDDGSLLSLPYNIASYGYIADESGHVFLGRSPVQLFSGVHDFSGDLSFPPATRAVLATAFRRHDVATIAKLLYLTGINGVLVTTGLTDDVNQSYPFGYEQEKKSYTTDDLPGLIGDELLRSTEGHYVLYDRPVHNTLIRTFAAAEPIPTTGRAAALAARPLAELTQTAYVGGDVVVPPLAGVATVASDRITPDRYRITLSHLTGPELLAFNDSFDAGWRLELNGQPLSFKHLPINLDQNGWLITLDQFPSTPTPGITRHPDGSIDVELTLTFGPQRYLWFGIAISLVTLVAVTALWIIEPLRVRRQRVP